MTKPIKEINVRELLPQQGSFVMVDRLEHCDGQTTLSSLHIREDNIFLAGGSFQEAGIIENMAQTAAAREGYLDKYIRKGNVRIGFIGEIKRLSVNRCPQAGETLTTTITIVSEIAPVLLVKAEVQSGEELIATGSIKLSMTDISSTQ